MKLLIIGGTGCLSTAVTAEALKQDWSITMINRGKREIPSGVELLRFDCNAYEDIGDALAGRYFDAVIDFLCYTPRQLEKSFQLYSRFADQYVYISSCAVYDTRISGLLNEESPKPLPLWQYSVDKWESEGILARMATKANKKYTVIRPSVTYGDTRIPYGIMPMYGFHWTWIGRILSGKPIIRWNGGINRCNMMRVEDFAVGCVGLLGNEAAYGEAYNICGDEKPTYNQVLSCVSEILGKEIVTVDVSSEFYAKEMPGRAGEILGGRSIDAVNGNMKIKSVVPSFRQTIGLRDGIEMTINAYKNQNYQRGIDWTFDAETDRIIAKWCRLNKVAKRKYKLNFVDYIGNATIHDRLTYFRVVHRENWLLQKLLYARRFVRKLVGS